MSGQDYLLQMFLWFFLGLKETLALQGELKDGAGQLSPKSLGFLYPPYALIIHVIPTKVLLFLSGGFAVSLTAC